MREIKPKEMENMVSEVSPSGHKAKTKSENNKIYPHIRLEHEFFPECKKFEVGKEYIIEMKVKMTGISISRFQNDSDFDILAFESEDAKKEDVEKEE